MLAYVPIQATNYVDYEFDPNGLTIVRMLCMFAWDRIPACVVYYFKSDYLLKKLKLIKSLQKFHRLLITYLNSYKHAYKKYSSK